MLQHGETLGQAEKILATIIRDGQIRTDDTTALTAMGVSPRQLAKYIHAIRTDHGIPLTAVKNGRRVVAYTLVPEGTTTTSPNVVLH